jgi:1-acyl-sn-glycerol-3-phosphate acyltransferase
MRTRPRRRERFRVVLFNGLYRWGYRILRLAIGSFLKSRYRLSSENRRVFRTIKPPYLVLPNHGSFWDPFFVSVLVPDPVYWIASDAQFRGLLRYALRLIGAIPKSKGVSDIETIRSIMDIRRRNGVIGIFPEGVRTWDGHSMGSVHATAKLIKLLKIPVVIPMLDGNYLSSPRWAESSRRGRVTVSFRKGFSPEEIASLSPDGILEKLDRLLEYDACRGRTGSPVPFLGRNLAESLELVLFVCPQCHGLVTLKSSDNILACRECGYRVVYNEFGFLEPRSGNRYFSTVHEWNEWQLSFLKDYFRDRYRAGLSQRFFDDRLVWVWMGYRSQPLRRLRVGRLSLYSDRILFTSINRTRFIFDIERIQGINVQHGERLEFYHDGRLFQFRFSGRGDSAYKWQETVKMLAETDIAMKASDVATSRTSSSSRPEASAPSLPPARS